MMFWSFWLLFRVKPAWQSIQKMFLALFFPDFQEEAQGDEITDNGKRECQNSSPDHKDNRCLITKTDKGSQRLIHALMLKQDIQYLL